MSSFLVVRAGGERVGLGLAAVREVVDLLPPRPVPSRAGAFRGVMPHRDRFVSLLHLGALLRGEAPPAALGDTAVLVDVADAAVALEVDAVDEVADHTAAFVGSAPVVWASGVWRVGPDLVTVLDLEVLAQRISESGGDGDAAG